MDGWIGFHSVEALRDNVFTAATDLDPKLTRNMANPVSDGRVEWLLIRPSYPPAVPIVFTKVE